MFHTILVWLLVIAFLGAGVANAVGSMATRRSFMRWGYPAWWCRVTGALEIADAALIAVPVARPIGLGLGAAIVLAAALTILRHREFTHLLALGAFAGLLGLVAVTGG